VTSPVDVAFNRDGSRAAIRISHPTGNIITMEMMSALRAALSSAQENPHLKLITIEGAGSDFSFGASIPEHTLAEIDHALPEMHQVVYDLLDAPAVTAAMVRGRCLGGGFELALACDFIFASDDAVIGLPEIALGVFAPAASVLLPARVGAAAATRALLTGEARPAAEWFARGLIEFVVSEASLPAEVDRWFDLHLAPRSAAALRHAASAARLPIVESARTLLPKMERLYLKDLMHTADAVEGISAFLEKRAPSWIDR
jgi:cyclohexa-1,5-dienecarbonyl-CoA hydratase